MPQQFSFPVVRRKAPAQALNGSENLIVTGNGISRLNITNTAIDNSSSYGISIENSADVFINGESSSSKTVTEWSEALGSTGAGNSAEDNFGGAIWFYN